MIDSYVSRIFKFSGAGNDFVVLDGRQGGMDPYREPARIGQLCQEYHTDGLMILTHADHPSHYDFVMEFYNPDGSGGMMCGNGGRCIVRPGRGAYGRNFVAGDSRRKVDRAAEND